jgi:hypothetical protein
MHLQKAVFAFAEKMTKQILHITTHGAHADNMKCFLEESGIYQVHSRIVDFQENVYKQMCEKLFHLKPASVDLILLAELSDPQAIEKSLESMADISSLPFDLEHLKQAVEERDRILEQTRKRYMRSISNTFTGLFYLVGQRYSPVYVLLDHLAHTNREIVQHYAGNGAKGVIQNPSGLRLEEFRDEVVTKLFEAKKLSVLLS